MDYPVVLQQTLQQTTKFLFLVSILMRLSLFLSTFAAAFGKKRVIGAEDRLFEGDY